MKMTFCSLYFSLLFLAASMALGGEVVTLDSQARARAGILSRPVIERSFGDQVRVVGQVVRSPGSTLTVKSIFDGRVENLEVAPGDLVRGGQVLVQLHSHDMLALQGELLQATDRARLTEKRLAAGRQLFELEGISRNELETREQEAFSAQLDRDRARAELLDIGLAAADIEELLATRTTGAHLPVTSPRDAVILELMVQEHQWVRAYEALMVLGDPGRVELVLQIPPDQAAAVSAGQGVEFVPVGRPHLSGSAVVISRVPQVDPTTRTVKIRARIEQGPDAATFPGIYVEATITQGEARNAPSVPESAVIRMGASDVVFVQTSADTFEARVVELGLFNGTRYEVRSGVSTGEEVVVQGVFLLKSVLVTGVGE